MNLKHVKSIYLLGIGGIGMSALARYFRANGVQVSGYDKTPSPLTDKLIEEGISIHFDEDASAISADTDLLIYTPAIPAEHAAFDAGRRMNKRWYKRSEVLEMLCARHETLAVAGTHGKTTTTAILAHLLHATTRDCTAFVGGVMSNYDSNLILKPDARWMVVEADEYDRSFLKLHPKMCIVTSMDPDHLDIYGTHAAMIEDYRTFAGRAATLIAHERVKAEFQHQGMLIYGAGAMADVQYSDISVRNGRFHFRLRYLGRDLGFFESQLPGRHNIENATAALAICLQLGIEIESLRTAMAGFRGVQRRFERVLETNRCTVIDDYAHHPKEIEAAIDAARELYAARKLSVVFQPHLYSRTRDLEDGFVESLAMADEVILLPIYPARERPIAGVSSDHLLNRLPLKTKQLVQKTDLVNAVLSLSPEIVLILGAGDVDRLVQPVANALKNSEYA